MTGFDAELHLRRLGERALLQREEDPWDWSLPSAAQALVAVDALTESLAEEVLSDYETAAALRSGDYDPRMGLRALRQAAPARPLRPRRVIACGAELEGGLRVDYVSLAEDETLVGVRFAVRLRLPRRPGRAPGHWQPPSPSLADDRGTTTSSHFSGGGGDGEWVGRLTAAQPLATDTAWIEVDGVRIALTRPAVAAEVTVEPLPEADPAMRHLWRVALGTERHQWGESGFEPAAAALIAAGALADGDPRVARLRRGLGGGQGGSVPEPWRSLRRGDGDGPAGTMALEAVTPEFDGVSVAATVLTSAESEWSLEVDVAPDAALGAPFGSPGARPVGLAWWARDDRGQRYPGATGNSSGGGGRAHGTVDFAPALDPRAARLEIAAIGWRHQALIRFPLEWT